MQLIVQIFGWMLVAVAVLIFCFIAPMGQPKAMKGDDRTVMGIFLIFAVVMGGVGAAMIWLSKSE